MFHFLSGPKICRPGLVLGYAHTLGEALLCFFLFIHNYILHKENTYTHTNTHIQTHAYIKTHTHRGKKTYTHRQTEKRVHTQTLTHTQTTYFTKHEKM